MTMRADGYTRSVPSLGGSCRPSRSNHCPKMEGWTDEDEEEEEEEEDDDDDEAARGGLPITCPKFSLM